MNKIIIAMAAIAAAFTMVSCNKEQNAEPENVEGNCIITASTESSLTKTSLKGDDTQGYEVVWSEGDTFKLRGETFTLIKGAGTANGTFQGYVSEFAGSGIACYPASYDGTNWPTEQTYSKGNITGSPMKADVYCMKGRIYGGKVEFKNAGGILRLTVKGTDKVTSITVCTDSIPNIKLGCGTGVNLDNTVGTVFHIAMPEGSYSGTSIMFTTANSKFCIKSLKSDLVITRSRITPASIRIDEWTDNSKVPDGALSGIFTVSAEGKKVFFSRGNLNSQGSEFDFATDQLSLEYGGLSHFYWSKNADRACKEEYDDYSFISGDDVLFTNADYESPNPDFTANGQKGLWRTLSEMEWSYLVSNSSVWATIKGVNGLVIFCDGYTGSKTGPFSEIPDGCAFLPAAGYREPDSYNVSSAGEKGRYLSSEPYSNFAGDYAYVLDFDDDIATTGICERSLSGSCIRLVTNVPDEALFSVKFDMNGKIGTAPAQYLGITYHTRIIKPADPFVEGCAIRGWFKDKACTVLWDFDSDFVTADITLYAGWAEGVIPGKFTVAEGKQVCFSKANSWADKSHVLHFEDKQYDIQSSWDITHVSLFNWSSSVADAGSTSTSPTGDYLFCDVDHKVSVDGVSSTTYYALSLAEWQYLFNSRTMKNGTDRYSINIKYGEIMGIVLYPDDYCGSVLASDIQYTDATFPKDCIFLPAAGYRSKSRIFSDGGYGLYWTSSAVDDASRAARMSFSETSINTSSSYSRSYGLSVRLVTDVK